MHNKLGIDPNSELNELFWSVFKASPSLMTISDVNERAFVAVNDAWLDTLKYDLEDVIGKTAIDLGLWHDEKLHADLARHLNKEGSIKDHKIILKAKDGSLRHCIINVNPVMMGDKKLFLASSQDITESRETNKALANTKLMLIDALESINEGFVLYGPDGGLIICNSKFREFYGYSEEEASFGVHRRTLGLLDIERNTVVVDDQMAKSYINRREDLNTGPPKSFEVRLKDGRMLMLGDRKTSNGGIVSIQSDITAQRNIEQALRRSQKMEAIGQLTGGIAHDFNNILNIVMGNLELIEEIASNNPGITSLTSSALKGVHRGADITKKLLSFSRKQTSRSRRTSINELLQNMEQLLARSLTASVNIELQLANDLWDADIDPGDLEDAILNIALNARDATPEQGTLTIKTTNFVADQSFSPSGTDAKGQEFIQISISDTGNGISKANIEKIFEPFFSTKDQGKGTGLGLSMVYGFVQRSKGHVTVDSETGCGTTVTLYLPKTTSASREEPTKRNHAALDRGSEKILVVDDEVQLADLAASVLENLGYRVLTAHNAEEALIRLEQAPDIDLLFTDVIMPGGLDGYQLALEALKKHPDLKILMASGYTRMRETTINADNEIIKNLTETLLQKPYNRADLSRAVRLALDNNSEDQQLVQDQSSQ